MAKTPTKTPAKTATKAASAVKASSPSIEKVSEEVLAKLKSLDLDPKLQADLEWCLGSYKADQNPTGLYEMTEKALSVFVTAKENKVKGVTAKMITDLEKAIKAR